MIRNNYLIGKFNEHFGRKESAFANSPLVVVENIASLTKTTSLRKTVRKASVGHGQVYQNAIVQATTRVKTI